MIRLSSHDDVHFDLRARRSAFCTTFKALETLAKVYDVCVRDVQHVVFAVTIWNCSRNFKRRIIQPCGSSSGSAPESPNLKKEVCGSHSGILFSIGTHKDTRMSRFTSFVLVVAVLFVIMYMVHKIL